MLALANLALALSMRAPLLTCRDCVDGLGNKYVHPIHGDAYKTLQKRSKKRKFLTEQLGKQPNEAILAEARALSAVCDRRATNDDQRDLAAAIEAYTECTMVFARDADCNQLILVRKSADNADDFGDLSPSQAQARFGPCRVLRDEAMRGMRLILVSTEQHLAELPPDYVWQKLPHYQRKLQLAPNSPRYPTMLMQLSNAQHIFRDVSRFGASTREGNPQVDSHADEHLTHTHGPPASAGQSTGASPQAHFAESTVPDFLQEDDLRSIVADDSDFISSLLSIDSEQDVANRPLPLLH